MLCWGCRQVLAVSAKAIEDVRTGFITLYGYGIVKVME
jgi:hypothetical protein